MPELRDFQALYEAYVEKVAQLERNRKLGQGIFGLKGGPKDDPCHDRFMEDMEALTAAYAGEDHGSGETREVLGYIYAAPLAYKDFNIVYWMLLAVQGVTLELVGRLEPGDAGELAARYSKDYPRWERMPAQKKLLDALKRRAG